MCPACRISNTFSPSLLHRSSSRRGELELSQSCVSLGKVANVFVLNVPGCKCFGHLQLVFGLGWISLGGEEMGQSSTHILRQFHEGFLTNAKAFFQSFLAPRMIRDASHPGLELDLHRQLLMEGSAQTLGVLVCPSV